jgi:protein-S-isoprenylcysteine O-methyltransferase Ste14
MLIIERVMFMMEWINVFVLIGSSVIFLYLYVKSVSPALLEEQGVPDAFEKCTGYRLLSGIFLGIIVINYVLYFLYPLPFIPPSFPWNPWISRTGAFLILIPAGYVFVKGMRDAGEETILVKKDHTLYGGIYTKIRHPQALGEVGLWWVIALLLNSPFLTFYSFVWIPFFYIMCRAEEKDLLIRYGEEYEKYMEKTGCIIPRRN